MTDHLDDYKDPKQGLRSLANSLQSGAITAVDLCQSALDKAQSSDCVFIQIDQTLVEQAEQVDNQRKQNKTLRPLAGLPISLKDLFNVKGQSTLAGSMLLKHYAKPQQQDAEVVKPLREAGLLFLGRTNMSEFAFSGIGKNPHFGTPLNIWDRQTKRLPGGSSSGSAVSVAENIVCATLGSDTAGSCRVPAAFNGIVGVKPSFGRMSLKGIFPLSPTSDAPGPLAVDLDSCFLLDQLMCGNLKPKNPLPQLEIANIQNLKLVMPDSAVIQKLDDDVRRSFERSIEILTDAGGTIQQVKMPAIDESIELFLTKAISLYEAYELHKDYLAKHLDEYDPFVGHRILTGAQISSTEQDKRYQAKKLVCEKFNFHFDQLKADAIIYPSVQTIAPAISTTDDLDAARMVNLNCLHNTATVNYFDGCAISLPCHEYRQAPVGLMLCSKNGQDYRLFEVAAAIEKAINRYR